MKRPFDFWNDHSDTFLTMACLSDRRKVLEQPNGYGRKTGDCGDTIIIYLATENSVISQINYELEGCINTNACCNALATLVEGKMIEQCWKITPNDIIDILETLPIEHHHCAELAVGTFYLALADCNEGKSLK